MGSKCSTLQIGGKVHISGNGSSPLIINGITYNISSLLNTVNFKAPETYGLPLEIDLKVGAKYMMTVNSDTEDGLVNGACGKLVMIDYGKLQKTNETVPCRIWIKFNEEKTGRKARANFHNVMRNRNIDSSLTPIEPVIRQINTNRLTKASGLYLIGDFVPPKPPEHNDSVAMMFKTMRSERMIKFSLEFPEESQGERFSVIFHNVQSLNENFSDIQFEKTFLFASMISLVETWIKPSDSLEIEGFKVVHRRNCNDIRKTFGQITYLKNHLKKHEIDSQLYVDENEQIRTDMLLNLEDLSIDDRSDVMDIDDQSSFEQTHTDISFNLKELKTGGLCASTIFDEKSPIETYEIVDLNTRRILDHFLLALGSNNTTGTDQISNQARIINDLIEKSPFLTVHNKDQSVRLKPKTEYSVQAFDSVYTRTRTTGDGNCLYSSLSIINIG
ncbi:unnamed protein product, partial [Rotaria socialis]